MTFPFTINGHTYTLDSFSPYSYTTGFPAVFSDLAEVVPALQAVAANLTVRQRLVANTTLYWRAAGTGNGFGATTNNDASAFPSLQAAYDWAADNLDLNGYQITLKAGNAGAAWTAGLSTNKPFVGQKGMAAVIIDWNGGTLTTTSANCVDLGAAYGWGGVDVAISIYNVTLSTVTAGDCLTVRAAHLQVGSGVTFGACAGNHGYFGHNAQVFLSDHTVSGGATFHWYCYDGASVVEEAATITFSAPVTFGAYLGLTEGAVALMGGVTYVNKANVTAQRFTLAQGSIVDTAGVTSATYLPGNVAGVCDESSNYSGVQGYPGWQSYTPTITSQIGTFTTVSGTGRSRVRGKSLEIQVEVIITAHGTANAIVFISLPPGCVGSASIAQSLSGFANFIALSAAVVASGTVINVTKYDGTPVIVDGADFIVGGTIEIA